jgi:hypothetical protein
MRTGCKDIGGFSGIERDDRTTLYAGFERCRGVCRVGLEDSEGEIE